MKAITVHAAKTHLSKLLERVERGEEIVIARRDTPIAKLVRITAAGSRKFGAMRGQARVDKDFFEPLPPSELEAFE